MPPAKYLCRPRTVFNPGVILKARSYQEREVGTWFLEVTMVTSWRQEGAGSGAGLSHTEEEAG